MKGNYRKDHLLPGQRTSLPEGLMLSTKSMAIYPLFMRMRKRRFRRYILLRNVSLLPLLWGLHTMNGVFPRSPKELGKTDDYNYFLK